MSQPIRREVWLCDLGLAGKVRPVLILSVAFGNHDYALFHVAPHTTSVRDSQFAVMLEVRGLQPGTFNIQGSQSLARANLIRRLSVLTPEQIHQIDAAMLRWLGVTITASTGGQR